MSTIQYKILRLTVYRFQWFARIILILLRAIQVTKQGVFILILSKTQLVCLSM